MQISSGDYAFRPRYAPATLRRRAAVRSAARPIGGGLSSGISEAWAAMLEGVGLPASDGARYAADVHHDLSNLTPDDRELIATATGVVVSSDGEVRNPGAGSADELIAALAEDRVFGRLQGEVTPVYLQALARRYEESGEIDAEHVTGALAYIAQRERRRTEDPMPRSSFSIAG